MKLVIMEKIILGVKVSMLEAAKSIKNIPHILKTVVDDKSFTLIETKCSGKLLSDFLKMISIQDNKIEELKV